MNELINVIIDYCNVSPTFKLFCICTLLLLFWLYLESAISMGVRNGTLHAENMKNKHKRNLTEKTEKQKSKNKKYSEENKTL